MTSGFDLINSIGESSGKQTSPDILPNEFIPIKRNKSLDDINCDDLFGKGDDHKLNTFSNERHKQAIEPFMKHFHNSPRKSNSESNLLGDWGENISTETLTPEVQHASSTGILK